MATTLGGQYIPATIDPGQEALAQTQASVLATIQATPVSTPAPISDTAAKIGIFANPTYPEPPVVSTPANPETPAAGIAFNQGGLGSRTTDQVAGLTPDQLAPGDTLAPSTNNLSSSYYGAGATSTTQNNTAAAPVTPPSTDWRVKLTLADKAYFLYMASDPGILAPLQETKGVIFPYTPSINMNYAANYDPVDVAHNNYKIFQYKNSNVGDISITADFTAQDTNEANYLLAVIHFFRSATKMFYGQDTNPPNGTPPPMLYLSGYGQFQFDKHPVVISSFSYHLPQDVDYIKAGVLSGPAANNVPGKKQEEKTKPENIFQKAKSFLSSMLRLEGSNLNKGAVVNNPQFKTNQIATPTYVPTKISLTITLLPMVSRGDMSQRFNLKDYANGKLYSGTASKHKGMW
jgi:hypothetical protein